MAGRSARRGDPPPGRLSCAIIGPIIPQGSLSFQTIRCRMGSVRPILWAVNIVLLLALSYGAAMGVAALVEDQTERAAAEALLRAKYRQYGSMLAPGSPVIRIDPVRVVGWGDLEPDAEAGEPAGNP